ncbi:MAG TPA: hypothetical protein VMB80_05065 [Candidatus Acidoferrum sp.]|nr:hypothetical protein [Candidatus Acidoferrum sp.]
MTQQKKVPDLKGRIARVVGAILLATLSVPPVRRMLGSLGSLVLPLTWLIASGSLGYGIYRLAHGNGTTETNPENPFTEPKPEQEPAWTDDESDRTLELFGPTLRRRYPWRH